jgi:hypothetical protein
MKKLSISIALCLLVLQAVNAQNQKGDQTLGLGLGFNANNESFNYLGNNQAVLDYTTSTSASISVNPNYSYFVANNLEVGISVGLGNGTYNNNDRTANLLTKETDKNYSGSVYLRKYILYKNKIGIRVGPYFTYQYFNTADIYTPGNIQPNYNFNGSNYHAGLIADFVYYPSKKIGLAVNMGNLSYNYGKTNTVDQSTNTNGVNLQFLNNNLMFSAFYVFGN